MFSFPGAMERPVQHGVYQKIFPATNARHLARAFTVTISTKNIKVWCSWVSHRSNLTHSHRTADAAILWLIEQAPLLSPKWGHALAGEGSVSGQSSCSTSRLKPRPCSSVEGDKSGAGRSVQARAVAAPAKAGSLSGLKKRS